MPNIEFTEKTVESLLEFTEQVEKTAVTTNEALQAMGLEIGEMKKRLDELERKQLEHEEVSVGHID